MPWGDEGVTKLLYKQDSNTSWGPNASPKTVFLQKQGIIKNLRMITDGPTLTFNGSTGASAMGPYNVYGSSGIGLELAANAQQDIFKTSGIGMYLINCVKRGLELGLPPPNAALPSPINVTDQDFAMDGRATQAPTTNTAWDWYFDLPVSQLVRSLGGDIGMIPMATQNAQLSLAVTPFVNSVSGSTYTINNNAAADDLSEPYFGTNAVTVANPTFDLVRLMYEAVTDPANFPDFSFVSQWLEETPTTFGNTGFTWKQNQDAVVLARLIFGYVTNAAPWGVLTGKLSTAGAIQLSYNTDQVKFKETGKEAIARQRDQLGFDLPQGWFYYDMLGPDLTLADVLNSYVVPAIQLQMSIDSGTTINSTINPKVLAQRFLPIRVA